MERQDSLGPSVTSSASQEMARPGTRRQLLKIVLYGGACGLCFALRPSLVSAVDPPPPPPCGVGGTPPNICHSQTPNTCNDLQHPNSCVGSASNLCESGNTCSGASTNICNHGDADKGNVCSGSSTNSCGGDSTNNCKGGSPNTCSGGATNECYTATSNQCSNGSSNTCNGDSKNICNAPATNTGSCEIPENNKTCTQANPNIHFA